MIIAPKYLPEIINNDKYLHVKIETLTADCRLHATVCVCVLMLGSYVMRAFRQRNSFSFTSLSCQDKADTFLCVCVCV